MLEGCVRPRVARARVCDMSFLVGERRGNAAKWRRDVSLVRNGEGEVGMIETKMVSMAAISVWESLRYL